MIARACEEIMSAVCAANNWSIQRIYEPGRLYAVYTRREYDNDFVVAYVEISRDGQDDNFTLTVCYNSYDVNDPTKISPQYPRERFGGLYTLYHTHKSMHGRIVEQHSYGVCCFCGGPCNEASQCCGRCSRQGGDPNEKI